MEKLPQIFNDLSNDSQTIFLIIVFFLLSCIWCKWIIEGLQSEPTFNLGMVYVISIVSGIIWIISFLNYGEKGNPDYGVYYGWILMWPTPCALFIHKYFRHTNMYGIFASLYRKNMKFPLYVYDFILRIYQKYGDKSIYIPKESQFRAANSILKQYNDTHDEERLIWFKNCITEYKIPIQYFGLSKESIAKIDNEKVGF